MVRCARHCPLVIISIFFCCAMCITRGEDVPAKVSVPDQPSQQQALKVVKEIYGGEIGAAKTPGQKTAIAKKLIRAAIEEKQDQAGRYALFVQAKDISIDAGDLPAAWNAIDEMDKVFQIDGPKMKTELAVASSKALKTPQDRKVFVESIDKLIRDLVHASRFDLAKQAGDLGLIAARASKDAQVVRQATARSSQIKEMETAFTEVKEAAAKLEASPTDADANLKVGRFRCFLQGEWQMGLPMLALGSDPKLKALAEKELAAPGTPDEQLQIADGWWELGEKEKGTTKAQVRTHAGEWYEAAAPSLTGLTRAKVQKRLDLVAAAGKATDLNAKPVTISLMDTEEEFRNNWTGRESKVLYNEDKSLDVEGIFGVGGFSFDKPWSGLAFSIAPREGFRPESFGIDINGTSVRLGQALKEAKQFVPVTLLFNAKQKAAVVIVNGKVFDRISIMKEGWGDKLQFSFWHNNYTGKFSLRSVFVAPSEPGSKP